MVKQPGKIQGRLVKAMTMTVQIPDDIALSISAEGGDLWRRVLEVLALEEFKNEAFEKYTLDDLEQERHWTLLTSAEGDAREYWFGSADTAAPPDSASAH